MLLSRPGGPARWTAPDYRRELVVEPMLASVGAARREIRSAVTPMAPDGAERAADCGSELVANAVLHGAPPIVLTVLVAPDHVLVGVEDGSRTPPSPRTSGPCDPGGRGTLIVDRLADRWGVDFLPHGKRVWCLIVVPVH